MHLTFLRGSSPSYKPAKSYELTNGGIQKVSDYDIGYTFYWQSFSHTEDLSVIAETLKNFARAGWFRINGVPSEHIQNLTTVPQRRLSENFPERPTNLMTLDLDIDDIARVSALTSYPSWSLAKPESTAALIRELLTTIGWSSLAFSDFVFLLTSSQFSRDKLRCHLYFVLEKGRSLDELRALAIGFNTVKGAKLFDSAPYNPVQPDYISPPDCKNFTDPIPAHCRIAFSPGLSAVVPEQLFSNDVTANTGGSHSVQKIDKLGASWLDTIHLFVGSDRGVNEPAFRAAAQLVHEVGRNQVVANMQYYAQVMHDEAWKAIMTHGKRGDASDRRTYDVERFKQYLESATRVGKEFGKEVDEIQSQVMSAVDLAKIGDLTSLTDKSTLLSIKKLMDKHPGVWIILKSKIKSGLKGIITLSEIERLVRTSVGSMNAGLPVVGASALPQFDTGPNNNENTIIRPILSSYKFIIDQDSNSFVLPPVGELMPLSSELANMFYRDGLERSGNTVTHIFGKKCMSVLMADRVSPAAGRTTFEKRLVGKRIISLGDSIAKGIWYNAGYQEDGIHRSIHLSGSGPVVHENTQEVLWLPAATNILPKEDSFKERFPEAGEATPDFLIDFFKNNILKYITCADDDLVELTSWLVTALTNRPLAYIGEFVGPHNCGKSTGADLAKDLIDPALQPLGSGASRSVFAGKVDENFFANLCNQLVTVIDNVGVLQPAVQDILCQVSTGMKYNIRMMYTQTQIEQFIQRPLILTGLAKVITRPDLISRTMTINFYKTPAYNANFLAEWYTDKPYLFGGLLHIAAKVMDMVGKASISSVGQVSQREIVYSAVSSIINGDKALDIKATTSKRLHDSMDVVSSSDKCLQLFAFLQSHHGSEYEVTVTRMLADYRAWSVSNSGKTFTVQLGTELGVIRTIDTTISATKLPTSKASFVWMLSKFHHAVDALSGWYLEKSVRREEGKVRVYKKKLCLTDIL